MQLRLSCRLPRRTTATARAGSLLYANCCSSRSRLQQTHPHFVTWARQASSDATLSPDSPPTAGVKNREKGKDDGTPATEKKRDARTDRSEPEAGTTTPVTDDASQQPTQTPYYFEAGYALFAKRASRPFPPPFFSQPSSSFSDPLSTHNRSSDKRPKQTYEGEIIRGVTNGDDAVLVSDNLIAANDGVGAWASKERGHAALWSRLIIHFWSLEAERHDYGHGKETEPDARAYLQRAFDLTKEATSEPNEWLGTTTASGALIHSHPDGHPVLHITQLGDSQVLEVLFTTKEQWHWFDCPRQLGTNSPDTPTDNAVVDLVTVQEDDIVLAMSDGVVDNLWQHEVVTNVLASLKKFAAKQESGAADAARPAEPAAHGMRFVATELVKAARAIAQDPFAESPFMERAVEEGLPLEGGKLDDISVVAAVVKRRAGAA